MFLNGEARGAEAEGRTRRRAQFETVCKVWRAAAAAGVRFPLDFCPGGCTPMEYFEDRPEREPAAAFTRCHKRFDARTEEGAEVEVEIAVMMACASAEEYYKLGRRRVWVCSSVDGEGTSSPRDSLGSSAEQPNERSRRGSMASSAEVPDGRAAEVPDGRAAEAVDGPDDTMAAETRSTSGRIVSFYISNWPGQC